LGGFSSWSLAMVEQLAKLHLLYASKLTPKGRIMSSMVSCSATVS
jgi:hypothetical protein